MFYLYGIVHHPFDRLTFKGLDDAESKEEFQSLMLMLANKPLLYNHNHNLPIGRVVYATVHRPTKELAVFAQINDGEWIAEKTKQGVRNGTLTSLSIGMMGAAQRLQTYNGNFAMNFLFPEEVSVLDDPGRPGSSILAFFDDEYIGMIPRGIKIPLYFPHNLKQQPTMDQVEQFIQSLSSVDLTEEQRNALSSLGDQAKRGAEYGVLVESKRQKLQDQTNELLDNKDLFMKDFVEENGLTEEQAVKVIESMKQIDVGKYPGFPAFMRSVARKAGVNGAAAHAELETKLKGMQSEFEEKDKQINELKEKLQIKETQTKAAAVIEAKDTEKRWEETTNGKKQPEDLDFLELAQMEKSILAQPMVKPM
jgi:hypothetical protein